MGDGTQTVIGRERELAELRAFLAAGDRPATLVLAGDAGVGKTTLWEAGIGAARAAGARVLVARASGAEARLAYVALADLLDGVPPSAPAALPAPQRRALEVALVRAEPGDEPPEERAVAAALVGVLRTLAAERPVVVAIDDAQWLDPASAAALTFAARRLDAGVRFLLAERAADASPFADVPARRLAVAPLAEGDVGRLLDRRLGLRPPRRVLAEVMRASGGNPLFALEVGRTLVGRPPPPIGEPLAPPAGAEALVGARVAGQPEPVRDAVLAVALSPGLRRGELALVADPSAVDGAVDAGLLTVDRDRVRLAHPLYGPAVLARATAAERRAAHTRLAAATGDPERQALHLASAAERPSAELSAAVAGAAARAAARGAAHDAAALSEHALRLTPPGAPERPGRVLALAEHLLLAGEDRRLTDVLTAELDDLPPGEPRVRAYLLLCDGAEAGTVAAHEQLLERAVQEAGDDTALAASVAADRTVTTAVALVERIAEAEAWSARALPAAATPDVERTVLQALAWARALRGRPIDDLAERFAAAGDAAPHLYRSVERVQVVRTAWRGEVEAARRRVQALTALADERGDAWSWVAMSLHACEIELRAGAWDAAEATVDGWDASGDRELMAAPVAERARALVAAGRGDAAAAARWVAAALAGAEATGIVWDRLEAWRAEGVAALAARDPAAAAAALRRVWEHTVREGVDEPGAFPAAPDLVEALAELGERAEAAAVADRLAALAAAQDHPWAALGVRRARALLAGTGDDLGAVAAGYAALGLRFDAARTLLARGRLERRRRHWAAARGALEDAAAAFDALGAPGWAAQAREELGRVSARRRRGAPGALTPAEQRVVDLAVAGRSNKEIARALVVSVHTVEGHLTRAYAKLGVRSRGELAAKDRGFPPLPGPATPP